MKFLVLGATGMLGHSVANTLIGNGHSVSVTYRSSISHPDWKSLLSSSAGQLEFNPMVHSWGPLVRLMLDGKFDCVINCIGVIKPFIDLDKAASVNVNSAFPHKLASICLGIQTRLIHITTDCVFSGRKGGYLETDIHDETDFYGRSKSLGEPSGSNVMTLRTSIIGKEIHKNASLISWAMSEAGKEVKGFDNHFWNGVTTQQFAKVCESILLNGAWEAATHHIFSPKPVSKWELLNLLNDRFSLNLTVKKTSTQRIDRTLSTLTGLSHRLGIPSIQDQINAI
jgi:dTDP-4-dehydrorhamnose reductase